MDTNISVCSESKSERSTAGYAPRYTVIEEADGFRIEGRDRRPVSVRLAPSKTFLLVGESDEVSSWNKDNIHIYRCNLYGYYRLLEVIAGITMQGWQRPPNAPNNWSGIRTWALGRTKRALHARGVYQQWQRLLTLVPEPQRQVIKTVFAATFNTYNLGCETWPEIYQHPYLIEDILRYRAAACAVHYAEQLAYIVGGVIRHWLIVAPSTFSPGPLGERFEAFYAREGADDFRFEETLLADEPVFQPVLQNRRQEVLSFLAHDWKALYSGSGMAGKSLRRMLMNLPGGVPGNLLCELPKLSLFLSRPVTDRVALTTLLIWARWASAELSCLIEPDMWEGNVLVKATREEIVSALRILSAHRQRALPREPALTPWKRGLQTLIGYLNDYCRACREEGIPAHQGNIVGLTEKAIRWHRDVQEREAQLRQALLDGTALAVLPPATLPDDPAITFLRTARDILNEGAVMHHCIASYASWAVQGHGYLFHVHYMDTDASVQVSRQGTVLQAYGPFNSINAASEYGRLALTRWGRTHLHE